MFFHIYYYFFLNAKYFAFFELIINVLVFESWE